MRPTSPHTRRNNGIATLYRLHGCGVFTQYFFNNCQWVLSSSSQTNKQANKNPGTLKICLRASWGHLNNYLNIWNFCCCLFFLYLTCHNFSVRDYWMNTFLWRQCLNFTKFWFLFLLCLFFSPSGSFQHFEISLLCFSKRILFSGVTAFLILPMSWLPQDIFSYFFSTVAFLSPGPSFPLSPQAWFLCRGMKLHFLIRFA